MSELIIELSPKIPICEPAEGLWAVLRSAPRPAQLAEYLPDWLAELSTFVSLKKDELRLRVLGNVLLAQATDQAFLGSLERQAQVSDLEAEARSSMFRKKRVKVLEEMLVA